MSTSKTSAISREFRITVTVEEVEAPKVADIPPASQERFSRDAEEFFDEGDYSSPR